MHPEDTKVFSAATVAQDGFLQNAGFMSLALSSPCLSYLSFSSSYLIVLLRKFSKAVISMQLLPFHHTLFFFLLPQKNWNWGLCKGRLL